MQEIWKSVTNHENYYVISNYGKIKNIKTNKILKGDINNAGYKRIILYMPFKKRYFLHRLVAFHFCIGYDINLVVNHKDGNKLNNCANNLEWVTNSENDLHAFATKLRTPNGMKKVAKYTIDGKQLIKIYQSITEAAIDNNVGSNNISDVCNKHYKQWNGYVYKFIK